MTLSGMRPIEINGTTLEVFDGGEGEPVMFIHGGGSVECHAVLREPALAEQFRLVHFHRRGYSNSDRPEQPVSFQQQAADCSAVLEHLGIERAHFVGESVGGSILLQYVLDYPETVQSLALLEPVLPSVVANSPKLNAVLEKVGALYESGKTEEAVDTFMQEVAGSDYSAKLDQTLGPGWSEALVQDAVGIFEVDGPAEATWSFTAEDAKRVRQPVLAMSGSDTRSYFMECHDTIMTWIPHAESVILPGTTHCMLEMNPKGSAERLAEFFASHPIEEGGDTRSIASAPRQRSA